MTGRTRFRVLLLSSAIALAAPRIASAQSKSECKQFTSGSAHTKLDCIEGLFSEQPLHLTFSSLPPGNGLPLGLVYEQPEHVLGGDGKALTDPKLMIVGARHGWYATGSFDWLPPLPYQLKVDSAGTRCHQLGAMCTTNVFSIGMYASHRAVTRLSFYGLGATAPDTPHFFEARESWGGVAARMPLTNWLRLDGQIEDRQLTLPSSDVTATFTEATAPGVASQPNYLHPSVAIRTGVRHINELKTGRTPPPGMKMKSRTELEFRNEASYHWYNDLTTGRYSFQQFVFNGDESFDFQAVILDFFEPGSSWLVEHFCGGNKRNDTCEFGRIDVKTLVQLARVDPANAMPFYFMPTIGGSDVESRTSLRGYDDYRFRGADAAVLQVEYTRTFEKLDPLGMLVFYDGGLVGATASDMWNSRYRQDAGVGLTLRLQHKLFAEMYVAAGNGLKFGYSFGKLF